MTLTFHEFVNWLIMKMKLKINSIFEKSKSRQNGKLNSTFVIDHPLNTFLHTKKIHSAIYKKTFIFRKVCQTVVSTKPKVVIERIPQTVCPHDQPLSAAKASTQAQPALVNNAKTSPKKPNTHNNPHRQAELIVCDSLDSLPMPMADLAFY